MSNLDPISAELATLASDYEKKNRELLAGIRKLQFMLEHILIASGADTAALVEDLMGPVVSEIVNTASIGCRREDLGGKTDMLRALRMCISAAWRFADAAYRSVARETDPNTRDGTDDPVDT